MGKPSSQRREVVYFNGRKFTRYPDAKQRSCREYYTPGLADRLKGICRLHVEVWKHHNGPVPKGWHIHHKDGNPGNNDISNLECVTPKQHHARHPKVFDEKAAAHLESIRPLAAEWHRSEAGRAWHVEHSKEVQANMARVDVVCQQCGATYQVKKIIVGRGKFCSNNCRSAARRASGVDDRERECCVCKGKFIVNRYSAVRTCSGPCLKRVQSEAARARVQRQRRR